MNHVIFSVYDKAAMAFNRPIFVPTSGLALRSFQDEVNRADSTNEIYKHPSDFALYELAIFDDSIGNFIVHDLPILVSEAASLLISI